MKSEKIKRDRRAYYSRSGKRWWTAESEVSGGEVVYYGFNTKFERDTRIMQQRNRRAVGYGEIRAVLGCNFMTATVAPDDVQGEPQPFCKAISQQRYNRHRRRTK